MTRKPIQTKPAQNEPWTVEPVRHFDEEPVVAELAELLRTAQRRIAELEAELSERSGRATPSIT